MKIMINDIILSAQRLASGTNPVNVSAHIDFYANMNNTTLVLTEKSSHVFRMDLTSYNNILILDRAETPTQHRNRGIGTLGLLFALFYGKCKDCRFGTLGTAIEPNAFGFWAGLQFGTLSEINSVIAEVIIRIAFNNAKKRYIPGFLRERANITPLNIAPNGTESMEIKDFSDLTPHTGSQVQSRRLGRRGSQ